MRCRKLKMHGCTSEAPTKRVFVSQSAVQGRSSSSSCSSDSNYAMQIKPTDRLRAANRHVPGMSRDKSAKSGVTPAGKHRGGDQLRAIRESKS